MENKKIIRIIAFTFIVILCISLIVHEINTIEIADSPILKKEVGECKKDDSY